MTKRRLSDLPADLREIIRTEDRNRRAAVRMIEEACRRGDVDLFHKAVAHLNDGSVDGAGWRLALKKIAGLPSVSPEIQDNFLSVWIETKRLPFHVGNRRVVANALRVLMPGGYDGPALTLYRGADAGERQRPGFSWTTDIEIARRFADWCSRGPFEDGVVLRTVARPEAILLVREVEGHYDEGEVVVDPLPVEPH
jgi:hypothetical protein